MARSVRTRFRAYQLGTDGSSFSYFGDGHFTIIEARLTAFSKPQLIAEMVRCGVESANALHITSWDVDHCAPTELEELLDLTHPSRVECPGYSPTSQTAESCLQLIKSYRIKRQNTNRSVDVKHITPDYISGLGIAQDIAFKDILYHPRWLDDECTNNNSTVKLFRRGIFNVLSLGDVESDQISAALRRQKILKNETDVMILAHHGADNGFTDKKFLETVSPRVAVCSSNFANQYDHPRQEVRDLLWEHKIRLFTTKTGDVIIKSVGDHTGRLQVINLKSGSTDVSSTYDFESKKRRLLSFNGDTIRQIYAPTPYHRRG